MNILNLDSIIRIAAATIASGLLTLSLFGGIIGGVVAAGLISVFGIDIDLSSIVLNNLLLALAVAVCVGLTIPFVGTLVKIIASSYLGLRVAKLILNRTNA